jgi:hypothetical protein
VFISPPFNKLFLKYVSSRQTDTSLGKIGVADFLGTRDDENREHVRLYRSLARRLQHNGLSGLKTETQLSVEIQRFHKKNSEDPEKYYDRRARIFATNNDNFIASYIQHFLCDHAVGYGFCSDCERILKSINLAEDIAKKARSGKATVDDFLRMPWQLLGEKALPRLGEPEEARVARFISFDVVLFLWVLALLGSHGSWKRQNIKSFIPNRSENLGEAWLMELEGFARSCKAPKMGRSGRYSLIAAFLVSGDPDDGPMETLAEELGAIAKDKKRLTQRIVDRHVRLLVEALKVYWDEHPEKKAKAESLGDLVLAVGSTFGFLQYARKVGLSEIVKKYPTVDIDSAFDEGLACWPRLVEFARV